MLKRLSIFAAVLATFSLVTLPVLAQETNTFAPTSDTPSLRIQQPKPIRPTTTTDFEKKLLLQQQEKQKWTVYSEKIQKEATRSGKGDPKCANLDATLKQRSAALDKNYVKASGSFREANQRMTNTVRLARQYLGDEASTAEEMLKLFQEKIELFESQSKVFQDQQREAQLYACKNSQGKFNTELGKLKQTGTMNGKSMQDITSYYEKTLRPELARLTEKLKAVVPRPTPKSSPTLRILPTQGQERR